LNWFTGLLKNVCSKLGIEYGRFSEGGFVPHDLRRNFATETLKSTDIETARKLLGHSSILQTQTYLSTSLEDMRRAVRKQDRISYDTELALIFNDVKSGDVTQREFTTRIKKLFGEN